MADVTRLLDSDPAVTEEPSGPSTPPESVRPPAVGAVLAAGWVALAGSLGCAALAVIGWFTASDGTTQQAVRIGVDGWLLAHRVPIELADGAFSLAPLGLTLVVGLLLARGGGWVGRGCAVHTLRDVGAGAGTLALVYGGFAALVAALARTGEGGPGPLSAFVAAGLLAFVVGGAGVLRTSGVSTGLAERMPADVRAGLHGGLAGIGGLLAAGFGLVVLALVVHAGRVGDLAGGLRPGPVGALLLVLLSLAYLPNAAVYAVAYALGPGFAVGTGTVVAPTGVVLGPLPAFPLLGAVPVDETPSTALMVVFLLPLAAGALAGWVASRRSTDPDERLEYAALRGGVAGVVGGLGFAVCALLASGSGGPGRMAEIGPAAVSVGLVAILTLTVAAVVTSVLPVLWRLWRTPPAPVTPEPPEPAADSAGESAGRA